MTRDPDKGRTHQATETSGMGFEHHGDEPEASSFTSLPGPLEIPFGALVLLKHLLGCHRRSQKQIPLIPEVTAKSRASPLPVLPRGNHTSAGRLPAPEGKPSEGGLAGSTPAFSRSRRRPASATTSKYTLRTALWRMVRSPLQEQVRAWSPHLSSTPPQQGQKVSSSCAGTRRRHGRATLQSGASISRPSSAGGAMSQARHRVNC